jgi:hypothetical protein
MGSKEVLGAVSPLQFSEEVGPQIILDIENYGRVDGLYPRSDRPRKIQGSRPYPVSYRITLLIAIPSRGRKEGDYHIGSLRELGNEVF